MKLLYAFSFLIFANLLTFPTDALAMSFFSKKAKPPLPPISPHPHSNQVLSKDQIQKLKIKNPYSFFEIYLKGLQDQEINNDAWNTAFLFFIENFEKLNPQQICLSKDNISNIKKIRNRNCLIIADYTKSKLKKRLHIVKFNEKKIHSLYTAHGKGSNLKKEDLIPTYFSNTPQSLQTSLGFFLTDQPYSSQKDTFGPGPHNGLKLDGISCTNNKARKRYIVMHTAKYVPDIIKDSKPIGSSEGCITVAPSQKELMLSCAHGALVYTHFKTKSQKR